MHNPYIYTYPNQIDTLLSSATQWHPHNHHVKLHCSYWPLPLSDNLHRDNLVSRPLPASLCSPGQCSLGQLLLPVHIRDRLHWSQLCQHVNDQVLRPPHHGLLRPLSQHADWVHQNSRLLHRNSVPFQTSAIHHLGLPSFSKIIRLWLIEIIL